MARPVAIAPEPGGVQVIGDASGAAEAFGVAAGMRLGEALGRCPTLALVPADPQRAEEAWEESLATLEGIGAAVESRRPGEAFFGLDGLKALWGRPERALERARRLLGHGVRLGAGPTRLCALAAALRSRPRRRAVIVTEREARLFLAALEVGVLRERMGDEWTGVNLVDTLERLGVRTLGELASLPSDAVADRFGDPGLRALGMARGAEEPLRPRQPRAELREEIELHDAATAGQLDRALELLVDRLLANPLRRGRSFRRLRIEARLAGGGGWRIEAPTRQATANRERLLLVLKPKLEALPAPALKLALRALELGEAPPRQPTLQADENEERRSRVAEAVRHARAAAGRGAVLRVLEVDPGADVPERWATLTPFPEDAPAARRAAR
ncbi:MAG: protein ImuB [Solirubrobacterales bacterium]|nr:protein ImuB [Solirubrobacterales bacterium]